MREGNLWWSLAALLLGTLLVAGCGSDGDGGDPVDSGTTVSDTGADTGGGAVKDEGTTPEEDKGATTEEDKGGTTEDTGGTTEDTGGTTEDTGGTTEDTGGTDEDTGGTEEDTGGTEEDTGGTEEDTGGTEEDTGGTTEDTGAGTDPGSGSGEPFSAEGVDMWIPAGALPEGVDVSVAKVEAPVALPSEVTSAGEVFELLPHGTAFNSPIEISIPYTSDSGIPLAVMRLAGPEDTTWEEVSGVTFEDGAAKWESSSFSFVTVVELTGTICDPACEGMKSCVSNECVIAPETAACFGPHTGPMTWTSLAGSGTGTVEFVLDETGTADCDVVFYLSAVPDEPTGFDLEITVAADGTVTGTGSFPHAPTMTIATTGTYDFEACGVVDGKFEGGMIGSGTFTSTRIDCATSCGARACGQAEDGCACGFCGDGETCSEAGICLSEACVEACAGEACGAIGDCECDPCEGALEICDESNTCAFAPAVADCLGEYTGTWSSDFGDGTASCTVDDTGEVTLSRKKGGMTILDAFTLDREGTLTHTKTGTTLTLDSSAGCTISGSFDSEGEAPGITVSLTKQD